RPVIRDEDRVGPDGRHDVRTEGDRAPTSLGRRPLAVRYTELRGEARMHLDARLRILTDERTDSSCLRPGQELAHDTPGGQVNRIVLARIVDRRAIVGDVEPRTAIGEIEGTVAFRHRVVAAALEEPRRALVLGRLAGLRILAIAGPEHTELFRDFLVRDA